MLLIVYGTDVFKYDPNFQENEERYKAIKAEILGEGSDDEDESGSEESEEEEQEEQGTCYQSVNDGII